jgi:hypothetical protein
MYLKSEILSALYNTNSRSTKKDVLPLKTHFFIFSSSSKKGTPGELEVLVLINLCVCNDVDLCKCRNECVFKWEKPLHVGVCVCASLCVGVGVCVSLLCVCVFVYVCTCVFWCVCMHPLGVASRATVQVEYDHRLIPKHNPCSPFHNPLLHNKVPYVFHVRSPSLHKGC